MHIGPALAEARTEAGMSVEDVSERTRIRRAIIKEIERDDYSSCGGDFYARGHIRAIAKAVGTDPVPLIEEYDENAAARDAAAAAEEAGESPAGGGGAGGSGTGGSGSRPELRTGPDPKSWLQSEGAADPLWRPQGGSRRRNGRGTPPSASLAPPQAADHRARPDSTAVLDPASGAGTAERDSDRPDGYMDVPAAVLDPAADPAEAGGPDTSPQDIVPYDLPASGPPAELAGATAGFAAGLRDGAVGAGQAGAEALQRAAGRIRQGGAQLSARISARTSQGAAGQSGPRQFRDIGADLRRAGAGAAARMSRLRTADQGSSRIIGGIAIALAALILILYGLLSTSASGSSQPSAPAKHHPHGSRPAAAGTPAASPAASSTAPSSPAPSSASPRLVALPLARVAAFGPGGIADGDNGQRAGQALSARAGGWHTNWYTTAEFGNLKKGTGLLLDMGRTVTVSKAAVRLGPAGGAVVQLRAGDAAAPAALRQVAGARSHGGTLVLTPAAPVHARYLLIWFTRLPPDNSGTYQVTVDGITVTGYSGSG